MNISPKLPPYTSPVSPVETGPDETTPFPTHCLPSVAGTMAREIGRVTTSMNEPLAAASIIGVLSAAIGAGLEVGTGGGRTLRPNLFILPIAESGTGKGENYRLAAEPFEAAEAEAIEAFDMHTRPGLVAELRVAELRSKKLCSDAAKETDRHARHLVTEEYRRAAEEAVQIERQIDAAPKWRVADVTKEALAIVMQGQPGEAVASMSSEARGLLNIVRGKYSKDGGDEDFYCSAYSGDSLTVDRVGRPRVTLRRPCLSAIWMIQPDAARKAFAEEAFTESGLLPRFLFFDPKAEPQVRTEQPAPIPAATKAAWANLIRSLVRVYRMGGSDPQVVAVSPGAQSLMVAYEACNVRLRRHSGEYRDIAAYISRWTENCWKLALVIHAAKHGSEAHHQEISLTTAQGAVNVSKWFSDRQLEILSTGRRAKLQKRLLALLAVLAEARGEISIRQLRRSHGFEEGEIRQLMSMFPNRFKIEKRQAEMGRPSLVITKVA